MPFSKGSFSCESDVDLGSTDIIAGKAENVVRVRAVRDFPGETNFSVITGDGVDSFLVSYEEAEALQHQHGQPVSDGTLHRWECRPCDRVGEEGPFRLIASLMYTVHRLDRRDVKHRLLVRDAGPPRGSMCIRTCCLPPYGQFLTRPSTSTSCVSKVVDKKVAKRTAQQETYIQPVRTLNQLRRIGQGEECLVLCFPQAVIPDDKLIEVEIYEADAAHQRFHIENSDLVDAGLVDELVKEVCSSRKKYLFITMCAFLWAGNIFSA